MSHLQREDEEGIDNGGLGRPVLEGQQEESARRFAFGLAPVGANVDVQPAVQSPSINAAPKTDAIDVVAYKVEHQKLEPVNRREGSPDRTSQDAQWNPRTDQVSHATFLYLKPMTTVVYVKPDNIDWCNLEHILSLASFHRWKCRWAPRCGSTFQFR